MSTIKAPVDPTTCPAWKALAEHNHVVGDFRLFRNVPFPDKPSFFGAAKGG